MYGSKSAIKAAYLAKLADRYDWAKPGNPGYQPRGMELAGKAADDALAGRVKLEGDCWFEALAENGVQKGSSRSAIAALPA